MAVMEDVQRQSFSERLGRIEKGAPNTMGQVYVGTDETFARKGSRAARGAKKGVSFRGVVLSILFLPVALAIGAGAMIAGRKLEVMYADVSAEENLVAQGVQMLGALGVGVVLALVLMTVLRFKTGALKLGVMAGFAAVFFAEPELQSRMPGLWEALYAPNTVSAMTAYLDVPEEWIPAALMPKVSPGSTSSAGILPSAVGVVPSGADITPTLP